MPDLIPATLVLRLFLAPNYFPRVRIFLQHLLVFVRGERIELLDSHDGHGTALQFASRFEQIEIDLTAAKHHARNGGGFDVVDLVDHRLEAAAGELLEARNRQRMTQQTLW